MVRGPEARTVVRGGGGALLDQVPPNPEEIDREVLDSEIQQLRQRVADLELTVEEYRRQMNQVITSASWRLTSPIRISASRTRSARAHARRALRELRQGRKQVAKQPAKTAGLFMPPLDLLPLHSPLRARVDVNDLRRPATADGPRRRPDTEPKVLIVAHVHYPELWADIDDRLARMPQAYDLIVSVTAGAAESIVSTIQWKHPKARVIVVPNRGRDWASMVMLANQGLLSGYDAVAKVHTKKSEHRIDGDGWRLALLDGIFESPEQIQRTIDLLKEDRDVGLIVPTGHIAGTEHWGSDQGLVEMLAYRISMAFDPEELRFPAGSMFWCRPWLLERLADLDISETHFEPEAGQYDATTAHALERLVGVFATVAGMATIEAMDVRSRLSGIRKERRRKLETYAFYLPQYHQTAENDAFWGEGFTDWVNVRKAKALFEGHRQPILPSGEVGFYDPTKTAVLRRQAQLASVHGVDGFLFHYYWFDGRQVLQRPISTWLADASLDMNLAICWANEPWTRSWDGLSDDVLIEQDLTAGWEDRFMADVCAYMSDARYIRRDGHPLLLIYRPDLVPDLEDACRNLRRAARGRGLTGLYIVFVSPSRDFGALTTSDAQHADAVATFPPGTGIYLEPIERAANRSDRWKPDQYLSYDSAALHSPTDDPHRYAARHIPGVMPGWDNTARRGDRSYVFVGSNPLTFRNWFRRAARSSQVHEDSGMVLVNAWNEWAEGAAIEPSDRFRDGFLCAIYDC